MDSGMFSAQQRGSLGLGATGGGGGNQQMEQLLRMQAQGSGNSGNAGGASASSSSQNANAELLKGQQEQAALEGRLQKLKEDIARRQQEADGLDAKAGGDKRKSDDAGGASKKVKTEAKDKAADKGSKDK